MWHPKSLRRNNMGHSDKLRGFTTQLLGYYFVSGETFNARSNVAILTVEQRVTRAEHRLTVLSLETSRMLGMTKPERTKEYGTEGPRLVLQALRAAIDDLENLPNA